MNKEAVIMRIESVMDELNKIHTMLTEITLDEEMHRIVMTICNRQKITITELRSSNRKWEIGDVRKIVAKKLRDEGFTLVKIGRYMMRDHSSIIAMVESYETLYANNEKFRSLADKLMK